MEAANDPTCVLILGGSSEATALATVLAGRKDVRAILSLAGRTLVPAVQPLATRVGGFGGIEGLEAFIRAEGSDILVDATHPFAAQISRHARAAAQLTGCPLLDATRAGWAPQDGDRWTEVATMAEAASTLGDSPRRVFLTVGRLQLAAFATAPQHHYLVRTIDPVEGSHRLADARYLTGRGPFQANEEERLMRDHGVEVLVTKNSGGSASAGKLEAARRLQLPVILVRRPAPSGGALATEQVLAAILAHRAAVERGV